MKKKNVLIWVLIVFFGAVFVFSAYKTADALLKYKKADDFYTDVRESYVSDASHEQGTEAPAEESTEEKKALPVSVDFEGLLQLNSDICGWIYCENTRISYPVVQSEDNDYYLRRGLDGKYLVTGTVFADYRNGKPCDTQNYIVYGHYMKDGSIFGCFEKYREREYYEAHPVMYYLTPNESYKVELFAGLLTDINTFPYKTDFGEDYGEFLKWTVENSFFSSDVSVSEDDRIMTLSTCSYEYENARCVLLGKLTPVK